jgi:hypothetical protein
MTCATSARRAADPVGAPDARDGCAADLSRAPIGAILFRFGPPRATLVCP